MLAFFKLTFTDDRKDSISENISRTNVVALIDFMPGEVVWAKLRGHPMWPAKIDRIYGTKNQMTEVIWFNDYRRSKLLKSQLCKFHANFDEMSKHFEKHVGLETAAKEALIYVMSTMGK